MKHNPSHNSRYFFVKRESGFALFFVLTTITLLSLILGDFLFDSQVHQLKSYNIQDREQAKLNAESGLNLAMARLRLYKEVMNQLESKKNIKEMVGQQMINQLWNVPFIYPIPAAEGIDPAQKAVLEEFSETVILQGGMNTTIQNISNRLNLNLLRIEANLNANPEASEDQNARGGNSVVGPAENNDSNRGDLTIAQTLVQLIQTAVAARREDGSITSKLETIDPQLLVASLKFFISDPEVEYEDPFRQQVAADYSAEGITPKFAPLSSLSELRLVLGWDDDIIDLIRNEVTVHGALVVDLNQITATLLRFLVPGLEQEQIDQFFQWKQDPKNPQFFQNLQAFQNYFVNIAQIASASDFEERIAQLKSAGLEFGSAPTLFKVNSSGTYLRGQVTIEATVAMPTLPPPDPNTLVTNGAQENEDENQASANNPDESNRDNNLDGQESGSGNQDQGQQTFLLEPRIVEIYYP